MFVIAPSGSESAYENPYLLQPVSAQYLDDMDSGWRELGKGCTTAFQVSCMWLCRRLLASAGMRVMSHGLIGQIQNP